MMVLGGFKNGVRGLVCDLSERALFFRCMVVRLQIEREGWNLDGHTFKKSFRSRKWLLGMKNRVLGV